MDLVLTRDGLIDLLKKDLWNFSKECDGAIYELGKIFTRDHDATFVTDIYITASKLGLDF